MLRNLTVLRASLVGLALVVAVSLAVGQQPAAKKPVTLIVRVAADAKIEIEGVERMVTKSTGELRRFVSPSVEVGPRYVYTIKATWTKDGKPVTVTREVIVRAGEDNELDLREEEAGAGKKEDKGEAKKQEKKAEDKAEAKKEEKPADNPDRGPDVVFVATPQEVVDRMLELAEVKKDDIVYDLGCGDGRIPVTAAKKYGCKAWGYDIDPARIKDSLENVKQNKVEDLVTIEKKDIFTLDLSKASVITLYLLPELNVKLIPQLEKLKPGSRIVSHDFDMEGCKPKKTIQVEYTDKDGEKRKRTVYLWTIPFEKEKEK
jgi:uncharacterized protein (TIGR03000 family)